MTYQTFEALNSTIENGRQIVSTYIGGACLQTMDWVQKQIRGTFEQDLKPYKNEGDDSGK